MQLQFQSTSYEMCTEGEWTQHICTFFMLSHQTTCAKKKPKALLWGVFNPSHCSLVTNLGMKRQGRGDSTGEIRDLMKQKNSTGIRLMHNVLFVSFEAFQLNLKGFLVFMVSVSRAQTPRCPSYQRYRCANLPASPPSALVTTLRKPVWMKRGESMEGECGGVRTGVRLFLFSLKYGVKTCRSRGGGNKSALLDFFFPLHLFSSFTFAPLFFVSCLAGTELLNGWGRNSTKKTRLIVSVTSRFTKVCLCRWTAIKPWCQAHLYRG